MSTPDQRMQILNMIESGEISADQALRLLKELEEQEGGIPANTSQSEEQTPASDVETLAGVVESTGAPRPEGASQASEETAAANRQAEPQIVSPVLIPAEMARWRRWWMIPFWIGSGIVILGGLLMYRVLQSRGLTVWFFCASLPFLLGALILALAWQSRKARWIHLRIQQKAGERPQKIWLSFPLPLRFSAWVLRTFKDRIPGLRATSLDEVILALGESASPQNPVYIQVNEGEDGEKVEIYIG